MLFAIVIIWSHLGTTNVQLLSNASFSSGRQLFIWFIFFVGMSVKVPMYPVHI